MFINFIIQFVCPHRPNGHSFIRNDVVDKDKSIVEQR
jgi:hypothetical protein